MHHPLQHYHFSASVELTGRWFAVFLLASMMISVGGFMAYKHADTDEEGAWVWLLFFGFAMLYVVLTYPFFNEV